jgi:hypothetical protein
LLPLIQLESSVIPQHLEARTSHSADLCDSVRLVAAAGYGLVEVAQLALHGPGLWADGLADLGFAALGALIVAAWRAGRVRLFAAGLLAAAVALVGGAGRRRD